MTGIGEEITLLPYDYDIGDNGSGEKAKESDIGADDGTGNVGKSTENTDQVKSDTLGHLSPIDQAEDGANFTTPKADESEEGRGEFDNDHNEGAELYEYDVLPPPPPLQQIEPVEPEEPRQPEKSNTPPVLPHSESNVPQPSVDQSSFPVHPHHSELPEPPSHHHAEPIPALTESEVCQVIATGMNTEMQEYASLLAREALTQFPNQMMAIARHIMMNFEERYGPPWCCVVSNGQLGFYLRYDRQNYIYFALSRHTIFLYKTFTS
ncbi:unnamed protein product [Cercopithifilaria johnstoni]|uniref:Dynein light chain n=1 Tax=Cercopithifilaria johnstoni TaxID=2874296 RepID=A0A8J2Q4D4_9BILA|nr:unnamed protein product [Cercopithifilaria johnstoni]